MNSKCVACEHQIGCDVHFFGKDQHINKCSDLDDVKDYKAECSRIGGTPDMLLAVNPSLATVRLGGTPEAVTPAINPSLPSPSVNTLMVCGFLSGMSLVLLAALAVRRVGQSMDQPPLLG